MSLTVRPEGWEPPLTGKKPERPEIRAALDNPGLWIECDWDLDEWAQPDSTVGQRRKRLNEVWDIRKSARLRKMFLRYGGPLASPEEGE